MPPKPKTLAERAAEYDAAMKSLASIGAMWLEARTKHGSVAPELEEAAELARRRANRAESNLRRAERRAHAA